MAKLTRDHMRRAPTYWWDFRHYKDGSMTIILETDDPRCASGVVKETERLPKGDCQSTIDAIERDISDLRSGRRALHDMGGER